MRVVCKCAANCRSRDGPHRRHSVPSCRRGSAGWRSPLVHDLSHSLPGKEGEDPYFLWSGRRRTHRADGRQCDGIEDGLRQHALAFFGIVCRSGPDRSRSAERIIVRPLAGGVSFVRRDRTGIGTGSVVRQGINGTFRPCFGIRPPFARRLRTAGLRRFCRSKHTCRSSCGMAHFSFLCSSVVPVRLRHRTVRIFPEIVFVFPFCLFIRKAFLYGPIANSVTAAALRFGKYRPLIRMQGADPFLSSSVVPVRLRHRTVRIFPEIVFVFPFCLFIRKAFLYGPIANSVTAAALRFGKYRPLIWMQGADPFLGSSVVPVRRPTSHRPDFSGDCFRLSVLSFIRKSFLYGPIATAIPSPRCAPAGSGVCRRRLRRAGHRRASRRAVPPRRTDRKRPDGKS